MKKLIVLLLTFTACTSTASRETADTTIVADSVPPESYVQDEPAEETSDVIVNDTSKVAVRYDELFQAFETASENYYRVNIVTSQYEASSEVVWYYDESLEPKFFSMSWSAEGNEGKTSYMIDNGKVMCAKEEDNQAEEKWCSTTGGTRTTWQEDTPDGTKELLAADYGKNANESLGRYLNILKSILKEGELTEQDEETYTVKIEKTVNYGEDFTETTEVSIPKKVYDAITGGR